MVVRISDKTQNYSKVTKLLVKPKIISNGLKHNLSLEDIASLAEISVEEVKQYIKDNHLD